MSDAAGEPGERPEPGDLPSRESAAGPPEPVPGPPAGPGTGSPPPPPVDGGRFAREQFEGGGSEGGGSERDRFDGGGSEGGGFERDRLDGGGSEGDRPAWPAAGPGWPSAPARASNWPRRAEVRWAVAVVLLLALVGVGAGAVWAGVAPRQPFLVIKVGQAIRAKPEGEVFIATDGWYFFITLAIGLLAGLLAWWPRSGRGALMPVALAAGGAAGALATWAFGEWLTPDIHPGLRHVGATLLFPIQLRAQSAVVVEAFAAVVVYLILTGFAARDDLDNP
jgi:hypothetical protein